MVADANDIDLKMDDGLSQSGKVTSHAGGTACHSGELYNLATGTTYAVIFDILE